MAPFPPDCLARFEPEGELASGGFGAVWRAHDRKLGRAAAVKVLHAAGASDLEQLARFQQEARVTAAIEHEHVVRVLDAGSGDGVPWIAYELLPGPTLRALAAAGPLAPARALAIALQIGGALRAVHAAGVLHRDVKPENVISAGADHFKVADFGIARCTRDAAVRTATGVILGTPHYIAPEVVEGAPPGARADVYSLGVLLYELIAGRLPFDAPTPGEVLLQHIELAPPPLGEVAPGTPPALVEVVERALAKSPGERFASAGAICAALEHAQATMAGPGAGAPPRPSRAPRASGALATAVVERTRRGVPATAVSRAPDPTPPVRRPLAIAVALAAPLVLLATWALLREPAPVVRAPAPRATAAGPDRTRVLRMCHELGVALRTARLAAPPDRSLPPARRREARLQNAIASLGRDRFETLKNVVSSLATELAQVAGDLPDRTVIDPALATFAHEAYRLFAIARLLQVEPAHTSLGALLARWIARHPGRPLQLYLARMFDRTNGRAAGVTPAEWSRVAALAGRAAPASDAPRWRLESWLLWQGDLVRCLDLDEVPEAVRRMAVWTAASTVFDALQGSGAAGAVGLRAAASDVLVAFDAHLIARAVKLAPADADERVRLIQGWGRRLAISGSDAHDALVLAEGALLIEAHAPPDDRSAKALAVRMLQSGTGRANPFAADLVEAGHTAPGPRSAAAIARARAKLLALRLPVPDAEEALDLREQRRQALEAALRRLGLRSDSAASVPR